MLCSAWTIHSNFKEIRRFWQIWYNIFRFSTLLLKIIILKKIVTMCDMMSILKCENTVLYFDFVCSDSTFKHNLKKFNLSINKSRFYFSYKILCSIPFKKHSGTVKANFFFKWFFFWTIYIGVTVLLLKNVT